MYYIGLDLGGTNSAFGITDESGTIISRFSIKTAGYELAEDYLDAAIKALLPAIEEIGGIKNIGGMGIGAPNGNIISGCIEYAPNIKWAHEGKVPIAQMIGEKLNLKNIVLTNDANAAAIGEMKFGCAKGMKDFIVLTLGTGVGSGIVCGGQLIYGSDGNAGELGHMIVRPEGRLCGCRRRGCLETYCSATGVAETARLFCKQRNEPSLLREISPENITSLDVALAAQKGDKLSSQVFEYTGNILGEACANMSVFTSPEAFILFGGLAKAGDLLLNPLEKSYKRNVMKIFQNKVKFMISSLNGADAAILGAASLAMN